MCGRFSLRKSLETVIAAVAAGYEPGASFNAPRAELSPSERIAVVRLDRAGDRVMGMVRWGLIPHWTRGTPKAKPINARAETVAANGMFKAAFVRRRCLIPADGFYEWRVLPSGRKVKTFISRYDEKVFAFAGVWERWVPGDGSAPLDTCTIITTGPNEMMAAIHDRQPAVIDSTDYERWLDRGTPPAEALSLLAPWSDRGWRAEAVGEDGKPNVRSPGWVEAKE